MRQREMARTPEHAAQQQHYSMMMHAPDTFDYPAAVYTRPC